jgi:hypothetical protein
MECGQHEVVAAELREHKDMIRELDRRVRHIEQRDAGDGEKFAALFSAINRVDATLMTFVKDMEKRVRTLEQRPGTYWDRLVWALLSAIVSSVITYVVVKAGLK